MNEDLNPVVNDLMIASTDLSNTDVDNISITAPASMPNLDDMSDEEVEKLKYQLSMKLIDFERLMQYAIDTKAKLIRKEQRSTTDTVALTCTIGAEPMKGSYNIVYKLNFSDSDVWVARIPVNAAEFETINEEKMTSEYQTMRYIGETLKVPVPTVYSWQTSSTVAGVPFALLSFVPGTPIDKLWCDKAWITEDKKLTILGNLATTMAKLQTQTFDKTGSLRFEKDGTLIGVGTEFEVDLDEDDYTTRGAVDVSEKASYDNLREWLMTEWDPLPGLTQWQQWQIGCLKVVELAALSIPEYLRDSKRFLLEHMDCNYQNIFIDDDCNITGLIDWDLVHVSPAGYGATKYPSWITRDWDLGEYDEPEDGNWEDSEEDSPEQLSRYRKHYSDTLAGLGLDGYDERETKFSHILEAIKIASNNRFNRQYIVIKLLHHAYRGKVPFTFRQCCDALTEEGTDEYVEMSKTVSAAFADMWFAEWEREETKANNSVRFEDMMPQPGSKKT